MNPEKPIWKLGHCYSLLDIELSGIKTKFYIKILTIIF